MRAERANFSIVPLRGRRDECHALGYPVFTAATQFGDVAPHTLGGSGFKIGKSAGEDTINLIYVEIWEVKR